MGVYFHRGQTDYLQLPLLSLVGSSACLKSPGQHHLHVRGYNEKGNIDTPFELAIRNQTDRYSLAISAIDRIPWLKNTASGIREELINRRIFARNEAYDTGIDPEHIRNWKWPYPE